jgi:phosphotransferase system IIA component
LLLEYDEAVITGAGYSLETQLVVCNTDSFKSVTQAKTGETAVGDVVLLVE